MNYALMSVRRKEFQQSIFFAMFLIFFPFVSLFQIHLGCTAKFPKKCSLGQNNLSTIPPTALRRAEHLGPGVWEALMPTRGSPLLVFVNSKSGDNQVIFSNVCLTQKQLHKPCKIIKQNLEYQGKWHSLAVLKRQSLLLLWAPFMKITI